MTSAVILLALLLTPQNDKAQANAYDDVWESAWKAHCRTVLNAGSGKTTGFVIHIGDSITHANPYGQWPRNGAGKTAEDTAILTWCKATQAFPGSPTATDTNGFYLCAVDIASRSMTASSSITTAMYLSGTGNGATPAMLSTTNTATAQGYVVDPSITRNLHITSVAAAFAAAQFAVVMLGTNDAGAGRPVVDFTNDLTAIVNVLEGRNIVVILSTLPPRVGMDVTPYNTAIRSFAQSRGLPLIDYYAEILARRPGTTWQNTLISGDGVHPTGAAPAADPYSTGGNPATHQTGTNATNDGYLLRGWLSIQKLKEVKAYVIDDAPVPAPGPGPLPGPAPAPAAGSDDSDDDACGCGSVSAGFPGWPAAGALLLLLGAFRRRR